jgi:ketosteroid isomerase-like protein
VSDQVALLFANEAFYAAFAGRDLEAMDDLWSRLATVTCIHPGWLPLAGRDTVMQSWQDILANPASPAVSCWNATAHILGDVAYVLCHEQLQQGFLAATNVFVRESGGWKLVHHQAGASPPPTLVPASRRSPMQMQ